MTTGKTESGEIMTETRRDSLCLSIFLILVSTHSVLCRPVENGHQLSVETVVVVDREAYMEWSSLQHKDSLEERHAQTVTAIHEFIKSMFKSSNLILQGLHKYGINIDVRIQDIRIVQNEAVVMTNRTSSHTARVVNKVAIQDFQKWLVRNGYEYDHALLLTGFELVSIDNNVHEGYAYMNTMCRYNSLSIVRNTKNGVAGVIFAHELSHSLGAEHDGHLNNCNATSGYIMNRDNIGVSPLRWNFSSCSANAIRHKLNSLLDSVNCLSEENTLAAPVTSPYLGQMYTADALCQMTYGDHSYVCRHLYGGDRPETVCQVLWCLVNTSYCSGIAGVDGVPCGANKRCVAWECVAFDDVPAEVTDDCYLGDMPHPVWHNRTCSDVVGSYTHRCLDVWYTTFCCQTCLAARLEDDDDCPYGDAHERCSAAYCGTRWESQCCITCSS